MNQSITRNVFEAMWIRPESAAWSIRNIEVISESCFQFKGNCLDFGGGDGIFNFLLNEGRLNPQFDQYSFVSNLDRHVDFTDIFDTPIGNISSENFVYKKVNNDINITNFDHKDNLLKKSSLLDFYSNFISGDANSILKIKDNTYDSIFSNIIYWLENPNLVLKELSRISKLNSKLLFLVPNDRFKKTSNIFKYKDFKFNKKFLEVLDRGRHLSNLKIVKKRTEWLDIIKNSHWEVIQKKSYLSDDLIAYWDIGSRPFSPYLIDGFNSLIPKERLRIKNSYVQDLLPVMEGFIKAQPELERKNGCNFELFVCKNKKS